MQKTKKIILSSLLFVCLAMMGLFVGVSSTKTKTASAATYNTPSYTTDGQTVVGEITYMYLLDDFRVYMHSSHTNGTSATLSDNALTSWGNYYITVEPISIRNHVSFKLTRSGYTVSSKTLSGNGNLTLYTGSLSDGNYTLEYIANCGNIFIAENHIYTFRFRVDNTSPTQTLKAGGSTISSGRYTNKQIDYTASDTNFSSIRYLKPNASSYSYYYSKTYTVTPTASNNGWWYFYATDYAGLSSSAVRVYLDTVAPVGKVTNASGTTISNGGYTNSAVKYTATDTGGISYYQVLLPGASSWTSYTAGTALSSSYGWYTFRAVDLAGNISTEYKVYYDAGSPSGTVYGGTASKSSGSYTNASYVKYTASDSYSGIANCYVRMPNISYYTAYASGTQLSTEGTYYFYSVDRSGNQSSIVNITLDKTKPIGTLYGGTHVIASGGSTNAQYIKFVPSDNIGLQTTYVLRPNTSTYTTYTSGTQFTDEGRYVFYSIDKAGNQSQQYIITLDRQIPEAQLYVDGNEVDNGSYTNGAHIKFECVEQCFVKLPDSDNFVEYLSGAEYYKPGKYVFYGLSEAGNSTGYYTIIIDRTIKTVEVQNLVDGNTSGDALITWTDGDKELYASIKSVTINGKPYVKDSVIYTIDTGVYNVKVVDYANNEWNTQFTSTKKNVLTDTLQKEYYEIYDADGNYFSFASYDSAFAFATERENSYVRTGEWKSDSWDTGIAMDSVDSVNAANGTYYIYKKAGNPEEEVAYFTLDRLNAVIAEYAKVDITSYYYWEKEPATIYNGENLFSYSDTKHILANSVTLGENIGELLNGEPIVGKVIETEGNHVLTVFDEWGNTCEYTLTIVRNAPEIDYVVGEGNQNSVTFDRTYYFKDKVTVSIADAYDEMAMFSVYDENGALINNLSLGETQVLTESGTYTVIAVNHAGKSQTFTLIISRNAPEIVMTDNTGTKQLIIEIVKSVDDESNIQTLEILKSTDDGVTWIPVEIDDYGTVVSLENLSYKFRTTGMYKAILTDEFRTGIDAVTAELNYDQATPTGTLVGVENNGFTNGVVTFAWTDEAKVTLTKDGEIIEYASGTEIVEDGVYSLTFENFDGYKQTYNFTIDTVNPEINIQGAKNRESVKNDVKVTYTEENLTAELFKNGKSLGEYQSGNPVSADGQYRIVVSDRANNKVEVEFTIDKTVDFAINVNDKGLSNSVIATANEKVTVTLLKNNEAVEYTLGSAIVEPADYVITVTDNLGNAKTVQFKIVEPLVKGFTHNFDDVDGFAGVTVNGEETRLNYGTLELTADGNYEIGVIVSGNTYLFNITVDNTAPTITVSGVELGGATKDGVIITETSEQAIIKVTKDGQEVKYTLGEQFTEPGEYKVTVTDECGNTAEYGFTIQKSLSGGMIALIVIAALILVGGVVVFILKKKQII